MRSLEAGQPLRGAALSLLATLVCGFTSGQTAWSPGKDPDPQAILSEAEDDARAGRYAESLQKHVWFHENALTYAPAMYGVRLSFALSSWKTLADSYPPALEKLRAERDEAAGNVRSAKDPRRSFHDFAAIDRVLGEDEKTTELFVWLDANAPQVAREVYNIAQPALIKAKEYVICGKYLDPEPSFRRLQRQYDEMKRISEGSEFQKETLEVADRSFANEVSTLIALLVVNKRKVEADRIADEAKKTWGAPEFRKQLEVALRGEVPAPWP